MKLKIFTILTATSIALTTLSAQTTMCFKEKHDNFATIEKVNLNGGLCNGTKSVTSMKKEGWTVDDIKISGSNYVYIFKKQTTLTSINMAELERKIIQKLDQNKKEAMRAKKLELQTQMTQNGKVIYLKNCQHCHGEKGELTPYNTSRALNQMNLHDFKASIRGYSLDDYDRGYAIVMRPYATSMNSSKTKAVYAYLQSLKPKKKSDKKESDSK
jgi:mono/diheme cytochrome c family protein